MCAAIAGWLYGVWPANPLTLGIAAFVVIGGPLLGIFHVATAARTTTTKRARRPSRSPVARPGPADPSPQARARAHAQGRRRDAAFANWRDQPHEPDARAARARAPRLAVHPQLASAPVGGVLVAAACVGVVAGTMLQAATGFGFSLVAAPLVFAAIDAGAGGRAAARPRARGQPADARHRAAAAAAAAALAGRRCSPARSPGRAGRRGRAARAAGGGAADRGHARRRRDARGAAGHDRRTSRPGRPGSRRAR